MLIRQNDLNTWLGPLRYICFACVFLAGLNSTALGTEISASKQVEDIKKFVYRAIEKKPYIIKKTEVIGCNEHKGFYEVYIEFYTDVGNSPRETRGLIIWPMKRCYKFLYNTRQPVCNVTVSALSPEGKKGYLEGKIKPGELLWKTSLTKENAGKIRWSPGFLNVNVFADIPDFNTLSKYWEEHFIHPLLELGKTEK